MSFESRADLPRPRGCEGARPAPMILAMGDAIGTEIRKARIAIGMTQQELADKSNLSRTHIGLVEANAKSPTVKSLFAICRALHVKASLLVTRCERRS